MTFACVHFIFQTQDDSLEDLNKYVLYSAEPSSPPLSTTSTSRFEDHRLGISPFLMP